jgi:UDP-glucuronate 4-epimerase
MKILVTGAAGFIGYHAALALLDAGHDVLGIDDLTPYYDVALKHERLAQLARPRFRFVHCDISDHEKLSGCAGDDIEAILHLAAQAGVRYSIENPFAYEKSNLAGHLSVLEYCRKLGSLRRLVYASSSSVYGQRSDAPFREDDRCDSPVSLYAATKRSCELMSETYANLFGMPQIGLRFFTVYGPFGRPDMAYWTFTDRILRGLPITLFNAGRMERDFTYIADIVPVLVKMLEAPIESTPRHRIFNLGNNKPTSLARFVAAIEAATRRKAEILEGAMQPGDVTITYADIARAQEAFGFSPSTTIEDGISNFVRWYMARERGRKTSN